MPFTLSHPALVLPLKKVCPAWFSTTGLVMGSMAPDFEYFLKMKASSHFGHTINGVLLFDLPISYLAAIIFHLWIRNIFIMHMPSPLNKKYALYLNFNFLDWLRQHWLRFGSSILIGILSHLVWDDFASPRGWIYYFNPAFFKQLINISSISLPLYVFIERLGSILGLAFLTWVIVGRRSALTSSFSSVSVKRKMTYWVSLIVVALTITLTEHLMSNGTISLGHTMVVLTSASLIALLGVSVFYKLLYKPG